MIKKILYSFTFILLFFINNVFAQNPITLKRVEPAFWWTGMKNNQLMLLVNGKNIGLSQPVVKYQGVVTDSVVRTENSNYLFIFLTIKTESKAGKFDISFQVKGKETAKYTYELKSRKEESAARNSFSAADVIYLLMPDRFANGDTTNDSTGDTFEKVNRNNPGGRHGGDIKGITNHLDYLDDLGVTTLWSTPLNEDNMKDYSYHTYAITDFYKIDPRYGTNEDYCKLSAELHKRNMKLIIDMVTNHCGSNHWWMNDLPTRDWLHQFDKFTRSNYQISTIYDPYASEYDRKLNFEGWFDTSMPDLNQDNPLLLTYLTQNAIWWVEYADLDGIRVDTYPYNDQWEIAKWSKGIRYEYPNLNIVGECWVHTQQEVAYWQTGVKNHDGYDSYLPSVMDFPLHDLFLSAFNEKDSWMSGMRKFYNHFTLDYVYPNPNNLLILTENHDTQRFIEIIQGDLRKFKIAYAMLFTMRGIPQVYYGMEILMPGDKNKGDGDIRRDFPGGWANDSRSAFTKEGRTSDENEAFDYVRKLMNWRKNTPVIYSGKTTQFIPYDNFYVYFRYNAEKTVLVIINNNETESKVLNTTRFAERMKGFAAGFDIVSGRNIENITNIAVPSKTAMIIELK